MAVSTVSYTKTPQANGDVYAFSEDYWGLADGKSILLDVMANDLGGNAKTLYSIDNGDLLTDLLTKDPGLCTPWEKTTLGHEIRINNGKIEYRFASDGFDMDELAAGATTCDTFKYAIQLGNGTISYATVTLNFTGVNDAAVITGTSTAELSESDAAQGTSGKLGATDVDGSAAFVVQTNVTGSNGYGKFSIDATGAWTYTMNEAHDEFVGGQDYTDSITVATADGTTKVLTVTMHGTNDAAVITGSSTAGLTESNVPLNTSGDLDATDVDSAADFLPQTNVAGSNGYGKFSIDATGAWMYTMDNAHNEFVGGKDYTDSITVTTADGTPQVITVTMTGTNDAAVITGSSTAELTEADAAQSTGGDLNATDVDSPATFKAQSGVTGSNGHGTFSIDATGAWTYTMGSAHNEFVEGEDYTDSFTVATEDGTQQLITVTMTGTNDAAVITGKSTAELTESDAAQSTGGDLNATDVDSPATFKAQSGVTGSNGHGTFSIDATGAWTYTMGSAHDEFVEGEDYTDSFTVATEDGTEQVITVTLTGTNDAAVITGKSTAKLTESDAAQSTGGDLNATDVDSPATFVSQSDVAGSNGYGKFSIDENGTWTYTMDDAHDEFVDGEEYTDSITVETADGTEQVITVTMTGTNDAAVITGTSTANLTESDAAQTTGGDLNATDVDSPATFVTQSDVAGSNGYGKFSIDESGTWTYTMDDAHDEFVDGEEYTDSVTVETADGTQQVITVTMTGTNDAAVITGTSTANLTESDAAQSTGGDLNATDVDSPATFVAQNNAAGSNGYGEFSIDGNGTWTYTMNAPHDDFVGDQEYTDSITVKTADGTQQVITVTMVGTNDAAVITGTRTAALTESNIAQSTGGDLNATDVDSPATFVEQSNVTGENGYGTFNLDENGTWTYMMNAAHDELVGGQDYTDSITVATADGTEEVITVTMRGTNDAAVITGSSTAELSETNAAQSTGGKLDASDVDSSNAFVVQTNATGSNGYGKFSIDATGTWTYTMSDAHNEFAGGVDYTDSITVATEDGTSRILTVTMHGTNDAAVITGSSTAALTETNAAQNTGGDLDATDADSLGTFVAQNNVAGNNGYGKFSIDANGTWTYSMNDAHDEFVGGQNYTDSITVATADGTQQLITVTMSGTNDAAVLSSADVSKAETNAPLTFNGTLTIDDVDGPEAFTPQTDTAGTNGKFSIDAAGNWTYIANSAFDNLNPGQSVSDSFDVFAADGTKTTVKVTINGTADGPLAAPTVYTGIDATFDKDTTAIDNVKGTVQNVSGGNGDDVMYGSNVADNIDAKNGGDKIYGFGGNDVLTGGPGVDEIYGGAGDDNINGGSAVDTIYGGSGNDIIDGDADGDTIYGGSGNDTIDGKGGSDVIVGGYGADILNGGAQNDTFKYLDTRDTGDTIDNFGDAAGAGGRLVNSDGDKIDFSALDADPLGFTADTTSLSAHSVISFYDANAGKTIVQVDTDGNASTVELQIQLTGDIALVSGDFIL